MLRKTINPVSIPMKYTITLIFFYFSILISVFAQTPSWQWATKADGEEIHGTSVDVDDSGNTYVSGEFYGSISFGSTRLNNSGHWSIYIAKYDGAGTLLWAKVVADASDIYVMALKVDASGKISIVGNFSGKANFVKTNSISQTSNGDFDIYVAKYSNTGEIIWAKTAGETGYDAGRDLSIDGKGNCYITGEIHIAGESSSCKVFIAKYGDDGICPWFKMTDIGLFQNGRGITTDASGNSYITGQFFNKLIFDNIELDGPVESHAFIAKFDTEGKVLWAKQSGGGGYCWGDKVAIDNQGNSYVTGQFHFTISFGSINLSSDGIVGMESSYVIFIVKYSEDGDVLWAKTSGGASLSITAYGV